MKVRKQDSNQRFGAEGRNKHSTTTKRRNKNSKKNKERLRNLQDNFKCSNICIIRNSKKLEIFENIRNENFPNLAKEIDFQGIQEAQ